MLRPEACASVYLRNIIVIMVETGLRSLCENRSCESRIMRLKEGR